ncbi:hypothetical protein NIES2101_31670 [Calothrix sp. HK-06]|nr:hypothetical protein NIES2101_31670 [Calothrix sp. HK-06]
MSDLTNALDKILSWLQKNYPSHVALLQPGLTEAEINELIEDLPLQLPQDIRELYQWKNGSIIIGDYEDFCWAFECWSFYPLELIIDGYCHNLDLVPVFENEIHNRLNIFGSCVLSVLNF